MVPAGGGSAATATIAITPLVLTWNEAPNISRCLERLTWARRVVVLDSGSTDETVAIARQFSNVDVLVRPFDDHTSQWNHGIGLVTTPWVLSLDADYVLSEAFIAELGAMPFAEDLDAVYASFRYCILGRPLKASLYPPRAVLFRADRCRYEADGHTQRLVVPGRWSSMQAGIDHDDRKSLDRWFGSQAAYARLEAEKLLSRQAATLGMQDRVRRTGVLGPPAVFFYTLVARLAILDGWPGWYYTLQRTVAETMLALHIWDRRLRG